MKNYLTFFAFFGLLTLFSSNDLLAQARTFTVNSVQDNPDVTPGNGTCDDLNNNCTLRAAITEANANVGFHDIIQFNILPGGGLHSIIPATQLPTLTDNSGVTIDGTTQTGASVGANPPATANLMIELKGIAALPPPIHGIYIKSDSNDIRGLIINEFSGDGIRIEGTSDTSAHNLVYANFIGTDQGGTADFGNATSSTANPPNAKWYAGVSIIVPPCDTMPVFTRDNVVRRNLISGNGAFPIPVSRGEGVSITNCPPGDNWNNLVEYNYIGTEITGSIALSNDSDGVTIAEATHDNTIDNNLISGNGYSGVGINGLNSPPRHTINNTVSNNIIGLDITTTSPIANGFQGVSIGMFGPNTWGYAGNNSVISNTIAYNLGNGVLVAEFMPPGTDCDQNLISQNSIFSNGALGIDLVSVFGTSGQVTMNDSPLDNDGGPNQECNFPVIQSANVSGGNSTITGTVDFPNPATGTVEVFLATVDPSGFGEGTTFLGSTTPTAAGNWTLITPTVLVANDELTATSTDANNNTSEFSANYLVVIQLGVELVTFEATQKGNSVHLYWETISEADNEGFDIEKSRDGINWENIGWVPGSGTSTTIRTYSIVDERPFPEDNYYRLQQVDYSGSYEYSSVEYLFFDPGEIQIINVFPNPNQGHFTVSVYNPSQKAAIIKIFDSLGKLEKTQKFQKGEMPEFWKNQFDLPDNNIYYITIQIGSKMYTRKIVVVKSN